MEWCGYWLTECVFEVALCFSGHVIHWLAVECHAFRRIVSTQALSVTVSFNTGGLMCVFIWEDQNHSSPGLVWRVKRYAYVNAGSPLYPLQAFEIGLPYPFRGCHITRSFVTLQKNCATHIAGQLFFCSSNVNYLHKPVGTGTHLTHDTETSWKDMREFVGHRHRVTCLKQPFTMYPLLPNLQSGWMFP